MFNLRRLALTALMVSNSVLATDSMIVRFDLTPEIKSFLKANEFDVTGVNYDTMEIEALLTQEELSLLQAKRANIKFSFPRGLGSSPDEEYQNPDEINDFIRETHAKHPDITEVKSIGKTLEGRDIFAVKISDNASVDEKEPAVLVNGMHHAREVMTTEITTDMIRYLTSNYDSNPEVKAWVDNTEIWVIPMFNLDGNNKMWTEDSMWRKNTRNGYGVDINRNYPNGWNSCEGSSSNVNAQNYRGPSPASEPETVAMMNFVAEIKPVFNISYHSYSEIVIYPFGCKPKRTPTEQAVEAIGREIATKLNYKPGTAWELLYNADGGDIDWMYAEHQVIPYVIEVNSTAQGFHPSFAKWRNKTVERNRPGWMHLLQKVQGTSLQGQVNPSEYSVIKVSQSGSAVMNYKINPDGTYFVILKPGIYDVSFEGTKVQKFSKVNVQSKMKFIF